MKEQMKLEEFKKLKEINSTVAVLIIIPIIMLVASSILLIRSVQQPSSTARSDTESRVSTTKPLQMYSYDPNITKQWRVRVIYNTVTDTVSLKEISQVTTGLPDYRSAKTSAFSFKILDNSKTELFGRNIHINQAVMYDTANRGGGIAPGDTIGTEFYTPYFENAATITLYNKNKLVLEIPLKNTSFSNMVPQSYADDPKEQTCGPSTVVFISDNYDNLNDFHKSVEIIKNEFRKTPPYNQNLDAFFDFQVLDNKEPLGCKNGTVSCMFQNVLRVPEIGRAKFPHASYFIILINHPQIAGGGANGEIGTAMQGGYMAAVGDFGNASLGPTAVHEFLGHAVGSLYDRYYSSSSTPHRISNNIKGSDLRSNCTDNPQGEEFWKKARVPQGANAYPTTPNAKGECGVGLYAPDDSTTCNTIMGCGKEDGFDQVEQYWIKNNILNDYPACPSRSQQSGNSSCGGWHQACCTGKSCTYENNVCTDNNTCELCGAFGETCCNPGHSRGITCINNFQCTSNHCCNQGQTWNGSRCVSPGNT